MDSFYSHLDMSWAYYPAAVGFVLLSVTCWLLVLVAMPGNWFIVGLAAGFAWLFSAETGPGIGWSTVGVLAIVAAIGEAVEFGAGAAGAAKQGASRRAMLLSLVGAMVGSIVGLAIGAPIPILGSLVMAVLGGAVGAFAGAYAGEVWKGRGDEERLAVGKGAFVGKLWGTVGKLAAGATMLAIVAYDAFF